MTVTARLYSDGRCIDAQFDPNRVAEVLGRGPIVWVDVDEPTADSMAMLGREFGFHELALEDCLHPHQRPKVERFESTVFLVAYGSTVAGGRVARHEMAAFVGNGYLVTVRKGPAWPMARVIRRWESHPELLAEGSGFLLYCLLDEIVDGYFEALEVFEAREEDAEDRILEARETQSPHELFRLKKEIVHFRRIVSPLREVLDELRRWTGGVISEKLEPYYRDVYDHLLRAADFTDTLRDILSGALETHLAVVGNRQNATMKSVTSWGAIILVPTLIAGIYGMNFVHMPELRWRYGYLLAVGMMASSALALYRVFKGKNWL